MRQHYYRDLVVRAARDRDSRTLEQIIVQLVDAERAREILRAKGYGATGLSASATAAQVPNKPK